MLPRSILYLSQHRCIREIICLHHSNQPLWRASHSCNPEKARHPVSSRAFSSGRGIRDQSKAAAQEADSNVDVGHSKFLAEAPPDAEWSGPSNNGLDSSNESHDGTKVEMQATSSGSGTLASTSSHLFKLILPLHHLRQKHRTTKASGENVKKKHPPTVFLLHPSQPLSHVSRLISSTLSPLSPEIVFRATAPHPTSGDHSKPGDTIEEWSDSTDIGDFVKEAARSTNFDIVLSFPHSNNSVASKSANETSSSVNEQTISVSVPPFPVRTRFLRRRLRELEEEIERMSLIKRECDLEAHRGARRTAVGGLGLLVVYWGAVARLTFWDYGWDIMEPVTYLSGLSTVIVGYLWFLYHNREVSYTSVLSQSISARRDTLYRSRGLDLDLWADMRAEARTLKREIGKIAEHYGVKWEGNEEEKPDERDDGEEAQDDAEGKTGGETDDDIINSGKDAKAKGQ
ncbi:hypothetical protein SISSUDRAFT_997659 [Sistotremastrum suecicum HHB10207 ss-3]|uniref:Calcium uniporter protein, mitochondrial n=1 Tax=Sistotremastrum suecicum HHB10207 ss-3 TaxID=1314776 RepID=A0A166I596_9AGAM|nr:hypothetical protein SISSUDRAFT_997659 [Sistotremastrum suecicum HHB10207 ss-3]